MFEAKKLLFWYAAAPVHMGAGTAVGGLIDNPIQREVHTHHPVLAGSGLKGALRELAGRGAMNDAEVQAIFGPDSQNADAHAGALSVSDAQIVAFPVRALKAAFVWITCHTALARLKRLISMAGKQAPWPVPQASDKAKLLNPALLSGNRLILEAFAYEADMEKETEPLGQVASWLADNALPDSDEHKPFRELLRQNLVLVPDEDFNHFVRFSTSVEPHVRINDETGTADDGGLFYTENLPPETLMASLLMAFRERSPNGEMSAEDVLGKAEALINDRLVQVGGDATTGRGLMIVHAVE